MAWSWRRTVAFWSASWLAASTAAVLALAPSPALARVCDDPAPDSPTLYPVVFTGVVESVAEQHDTTRRAGIPRWVPAWLPFASEQSPVSATVVRFEVMTRYRGDVHHHEAVQWLSSGRPHAGTRYTVFATPDAGGRLTTSPCAPNMQFLADPDRYGLVAQSPLPDVDPFAGWQAGAAAVLLALLAGAAVGLLLLRRRRLEPR
jgi:hypothetical protein